MRRFSYFALCAPAILAVSLAMDVGRASAQGIVDDDYDYGDTPQAYGPYGSYYDPNGYYYGPAVRAYPPPAYGYTPDRPFGRNGCGTYRFWNGERCVDARYR